VIQTDFFEVESIKMSRAWAMPSPWTFQIPPIRSFVASYVDGKGVIVDPFAGTSTIGTHRNDLRHSGKTSEAWLDELVAQGLTADLLLFDPPYSPRQMAECYDGAGLNLGMRQSQTAALYSECKDKMDRLAMSGTIALSFGWSSVGFGKNRGWRMIEILLVCHGGAHNDTICVAEVKR
jgi:hypothetical protein